MNEKLSQTGKHLLTAVAYGDAAGLPFEKKAALEPGSLSGLNPVTKNPFLGEYPIGTWSDDTQLSLAVTEGIIEAGGFNLDEQARAHIKALRHVRGQEGDEQWVPAIVTTRRQNGWGKSTTKAIERLEAGIDPLESGEPEGAGNGVLMKLAPLVFWQLARRTRHRDMLLQARDLTRMTHAAKEAEVCSATYTATLKALSRIDGASCDQEAIRFVVRHAADYAYKYEKLYNLENATSSTLARLDRLVVSKWGLNRHNLLEAAPKGGFYAPETLVMALGSFALEYHYPDSVYRAVELGGDSDSVGSIVGAMSAFLYGKLSHPADHQALFAIDRLEATSHKLAKLALNK